MSIFSSLYKNKLELGIQLPTKQVYSFVSFSWKPGFILLTLYGNAIDKPVNPWFGFSIDSTSQHASLIRGEDQVPGNADPERSRWG